MDAEWNRLRRAVSELADRCAKADPANTALYQREAQEFCDLLPPTSEEELTCLQADAEMVRLRWIARLKEPGGDPAAVRNEQASP